MKRIILFLLLIAILIPTTVNAQGGDEWYRVDENGVEWERVGEVWTWYHSADGSTSEETVFVWKEVEIINSYSMQYYDGNTGKIVCWDACWHEVAHKLDHEIMNRVSQGEDFHDAILWFLYQEMGSEGFPHPMALNILLFPGFFADWDIFGDDTGEWAGYKWGGYSELYADILFWANGDIEQIPQELREFYDMDAAQKMYDYITAPRSDWTSPRDEIY